MKISMDVQKNNLRRILFASCSGVLYSLLIIVCFTRGYLLIDDQYVVILMSTFWLGYVVTLAYVYGRYRKQVSVPSMTLPHMIWAILFISILMYHAVEIRPALMMSYLTILSFGAFRLQWRGFFGVILFTLTCHAITLFLLQQNRPGHWSPEVEVIIGLAFLLAMLGYSVFGNEFSVMRKRFRNTQDQLRSALAKIEMLAMTDELTGLYNRSHLMVVLEQQRAISDREDTPFVIAFIDLDDFKLIHERYGYDVCDEVLCRFSELLKDSIREVDAVARYSNTEFVLLLNGVGIDIASIVLERIRFGVELLLFSNSELNLTISAGVTEYNPPEGASDALARAGMLLEQAKQEGRNRIVNDSDADNRRQMDLLT